jgi:prevent-host-death family protein
MPVRQKRWPVQEAKARFSAFLRATRETGPQVVTLRGRDEAVLVPIEVWQGSNGAGRATLKDWLLAPSPRGDLAVPKRRKWRGRAPVSFD